MMALRSRVEIFDLRPKAVHEQLLRLKLVAEANTFNLPHVTVVHIHSADPSTPRKMLAALPALPPVRSTGT